MINIISIKEDHTLYETLRSVTKNIKRDINILGLDSPDGIKHSVYLASENFELPFFLYLEEPNTFDGRPPIEEETPWSPVDKRILRIFLENKNFMGFISHIKDTCRIMSERYKKNCFHLPLSSNNKNLSLIKQRIKSLNKDRPVKLHASNSWNDINSNNFFNRGGRIVDEIITRLLDEDTSIEFTIRANLLSLPSKRKYPKNVHIVSEYLPKRDLEFLMSQQDIYLLPSKQVHSASLTEVFSFGMPCVTSTGWGISEFCFDGLNSLVYEIEEEARGFCVKPDEPLPEKYLSNIVPRIKNLCENREMLIKKSEDVLAWYMTNHSRENHVNNFNNLINYALKFR